MKIKRSIAVRIAVFPFARVHALTGDFGVHANRTFIVGLSP
ncbi:hypothetical protein [Pandoraea oxalativorans]|nr:hypothetical protein [Pandoraea oxalativorans]